MSQDCAWNARLTFLFACLCVRLCRMSPSCELNDGNPATTLPDPNSFQRFTPMHKSRLRRRVDESPVLAARACHDYTTSSRDLVRDEDKGVTISAYRQLAPTDGLPPFRSDRKRLVTSVVSAGCVTRHRISRLARREHSPTRPRRKQSSNDLQHRPIRLLCSVEQATPHPRHRVAHNDPSWSWHHGRSRWMEKSRRARRLAKRRKRKMRMMTMARLIRMRRVCHGLKASVGLVTASRR